MKEINHWKLVIFLKTQKFGMLLVMITVTNHILIRQNNIQL